MLTRFFGAPLRGLRGGRAAVILASLLLFNTLSPAGFPASSATPAAQSCSGNCLNPHPGQFRWWNGQQKQCWVQVFRQWPEGCTHYQWFNNCTGAWDVDQNGNARIYWTCCVH